jgi:hypothetical protein
MGLPSCKHTEEMKVLPESSAATIKFNWGEFIWTEARP